MFGIRKSVIRLRMNSFPIRDFLVNKKIIFKRKFLDINERKENISSINILKE